MVRTRLCPTVKCEVCYNRYKSLATHLKTHGHSVKTYKATFDGAQVVSPLTRRKLQMARARTILAKRGGVAPVVQESKVKRRLPPLSAEARAKISASLKGRKLSPEHRQNISMALMGHSVSNETRFKLSQVVFTDEHKRKISEAQQAERGNAWKGGKSRYLYMSKGKYRLKRIFGAPLKCFFPGCDKVEGENVKSVDCHHLDGDHENNPLDGMNWLPLCRRHHMLADGRMPGSTEEQVAECRELAFKAHAEYMKDHYIGEIKGYFD